MQSLIVKLCFFVFTCVWDLPVVGRQHVEGPLFMLFAPAERFPNPFHRSLLGGKGGVGGRDNHHISRLSLGKILQKKSLGSKGKEIKAALLCVKPSCVRLVESHATLSSRHSELTLSSLVFVAAWPSSGDTGGSEVTSADWGKSGLEDLSLERWKQEEEYGQGVRVKCACAVLKGHIWWNKEYRSRRRQRSSLVSESPQWRCPRGCWEGCAFPSQWSPQSRWRPMERWPP